MCVGVERHLCEQRERELRRNRHFLGCGQCEVRHIELVGIGAFPRGKSHFGRPVQTAQLEGDRQGDVGGVGMLAERLGWMLTPPQDVLVVTSVMMSTLFALILVFICLYLLKMITDGPGDQAGGYCFKSVHFPVSFFTLFLFLFSCLLFHASHLRIRRMASSQSSWVPKAVRRRNPSPLGPKPTPGVPTTLAS